MPLYIKDPEVDRLTNELISLTKSSKVDAVKDALKSAIANKRANLPIREKLAKTFAMMNALGPLAPGDHKQETDDMWGESG